MAKKVLMPKLGLTMKTGKIVKWHVKEGDYVKKGQDLFDVENEKLTNTVQAPENGILAKIMLGEGESGEVLSPVGILAKEGEDISGMIEEAEPREEKKNREKKGKKVVVVGGGPGGYVAAIRAAQLGAQVTLIEKNKLGGTCLNIGCIPTKSLLHTAGLFSDLKTRGSEIGVAAEGLRVDYARMMAHKDAVVDQLVRGVEGLLRHNKVELVRGEAKFTGEGKMAYKDDKGRSNPVDADAVILATGSVNSMPPISGLKDNSACIDSTGALSLDELPKSMVIIGAGVIGMEMACVYGALGTKVTVVEALDHVLPMLDGSIAEVGVAHMKDEGIDVELNCPVQSVEKDGEGAVVVCKRDGEELTFKGEKVLVAVGRKANTGSLNLSRSGLSYNKKGEIRVNEKMETGIEGIYAIGDCVQGYAKLAHTASAMGEVAAENIMGEASVYDESSNPTAVYMEPEAVSVGITEEEAEAKGIAYKVGSFPMAANGRALILNGGEGLVKLIVGSDYGEILGMHIIGPHATDLIAEGALAIKLEATVDEIVGTIHGHPTVSEAVREAALNAVGRSIHMTND
ncbi:MAG: dihydrolipoyl dehydrogenase [Peptoniphilus sp.]|nr:dihydrolipoyl dehydrogenase [Peptoniphilus sp.]MDD7362627.1 dihydrolipoyl dehydrogenase [Bacillota bacterium]MDY6044974.1 dihydrolipoyl dehydrogenase [Peptoniphilus sp.]